MFQGNYEVLKYFVEFIEQIRAGPCKIEQQNMNVTLIQKNDRLVVSQPRYEKYFKSRYKTS